MEKDHPLKNKLKKIIINILIEYKKISHRICISCDLHFLLFKVTLKQVTWIFHIFKSTGCKVREGVWNANLQAPSAQRESHSINYKLTYLIGFQKIYSKECHLMGYPYYFLSKIVPCGKASYFFFFFYYFNHWTSCKSLIFNYLLYFKLLPLMV